MKRITVTVSNDLSYDQRMHKICSALANNGYQITLIGRLLPQSQSFHHADFKSKRLKCFFNKGKLFYIEYNIRLLLLLLYYPTDIMYAVDLDTLLPNTLSGSLRHKKMVFDAHEYFTEVPEVYDRPFVKRIWKSIEDFCVPQMDLCITVGECLAEIFTKMHGMQFHTIRNVPELKEEDFAEEAGDFILYQGALNVGRGLEELIKAMPSIPLKLKIAGQGDITEELIALSKKEGMENKIEFLGWVSPADLKKLSKQAFLGYNLLENTGKSYYYSLANKFFDYMHAGVPCLCSPFPEYQKINSLHNIAILTNLCAPEIVLEITKAFSEKAYYYKLKENCRIARQLYNWQRESKHLIELFHGL